MTGVRQRGQSMTEFIIVTPVMLLLVFGTIQFALIYQAKTTLNYATFEAARVGALNAARRDPIERGFARGMAPLYTHKDDIDSLQEGREQVMKDIRRGFVCIQRINPPDKAFKDFAIPDEAGEIPNDNLKYRSPARGSNSGLTLQDANLLKLKVTYCYPLYVPIVNRTIMAALSPVATSDGTFVDNPIFHPEGSPPIPVKPSGKFQTQCLRADRIPISAQAIVRMQSPAVNEVFDTDCS